MPKQAPTQLPSTHEHDEHEAEDPKQLTLKALEAVPWLSSDVISIVIDLLFSLVMCECGEKIKIETEFCMNNLFENVHDHPAGRKYKFCKGFNHVSCSVCKKDICCMCSSYGLCSVANVLFSFFFINFLLIFVCNRTAA